MFVNEINIIPQKTEQTIIDTLLTLESDGLNKNTVAHIGWKLRELARNTDITNPEEVKRYIANAKNHTTEEPLQNETKNKLAYAYDKHCKKQNIEWNKPHYKVEEKTPLIPTTENVKAIINIATGSYTTIFTILAETGVEGKELSDMIQNDIDTEQGIIRVRGNKGHASGTYKLKTQTAEMLRTYLTKNQQLHPFPNSELIGDAWRGARTKAIKKLCKPELAKIPLKNLRNYSGAQFYNNYGKDAISTMRHLRHKKLETTMHYLRGIVIDEEPEYVSKTATTVKEIQNLVDTGFSKADEIDGIHIYRKRK